MECENCQIQNCPVLNPSECPINKMWKRTNELQAFILDTLWNRTSEAQSAIEEAERIIGRN